LKAAAFYLLNKTESISIKNSQVCIIPVGSDWINREPLVGFPNALKVGEYVKPDNCVLDLIIAASSNPNKPFFLILDEMNLSHVERYFADFLSVMESSGNILLHPGPDKWSGIPSEVSLPENLFIIGTVNIDETTYMFSPKVLDRANVIEFRLTKDEISEYLNNYSSLDLSILESKGTHMAESFLQIAADQNLKPVETEKIKSTLIDFFIELRKTEAEFGYRTASEIMRFVAVVNLIEPKWSSNEILDAAIMQKLLPKVHGSRKKLAPVLEVLGILCMNEKPKDGEKMEYFFNAIDEKDFSARIKFPKSFEKISRMYRALLHNGFTSYAEA
jgi:5-methylcytosine-specific restriction protein B